MIFVYKYLLCNKQKIKARKRYDKNEKTTYNTKGTSSLHKINNLQTQSSVFFLRESVNRFAEVDFIELTKLDGEDRKSSQAILAHRCAQVALQSFDGREGPLR